MVSPASIAPGCAVPRARAERGQLGLDVGLLGHRVELAGDVVALAVELTSSSAPEAISSSIAPARACICAVLSSARCTAMPTSLSSEIPENASLMRVCASAAV